MNKKVKSTLAAFAVTALAIGVVAPNIHSAQAADTNTPATQASQTGQLAQAQAKTGLPNIAVLATGGTIAGTGSSATQTTGYQAGQLSGASLVAAVPGLDQIANITTEQVANIDSGIGNTNAYELNLARQVQKQLDDPKVDGVVITHGTDTLEETAYFLNLVIHSDKPVVLVGSMRPSTAISADGPLNLYNAVALAGSKDAKGKGVLISMNDKIGDARDTTKTNTTGVDTFKNPELGYLGYMQGAQPHFYNLPAKIHTTESDFNIKDLPDTLPRVDIVYSYANADSVEVNAAVAAGAKGIIHAGTGDGSVAQGTLPGLQNAVKQGVVVVDGTRVPDGMVTHEDFQIQNHFVTSDNLNPQKARILLELALTKTSDPNQIQQYFDRY